METKQSITIQFCTVRTVAEKLFTVCQIAQNLFLRKEKLMITVGDEASEQFIDQLLWKLPPDSFLPHCVRSSECEEPIVISKGRRNLNNAGALLNLNPTPSPIALQFFHIYELMDETDPSKLIASQKKWDIYAQAGYHIVK